MPAPPRTSPSYAGQGNGANLADILERVLDKGIVIAGDIKINLLDIELLTIKLRLLVASVDKAKEMGIDWWEHDPSLSSRAQPSVTAPAASDPALSEENERLRAEIARLRAAAELPAGHTADGDARPEPAEREAGRE
ncbi:gas vesicle protein [Streptomyces sp. BK022]|uniref:gas vesicle protein n=1 Tax=Streptomyces sp. BK022 TaxID=2512123 RepID=UPI00102961C5|nr:gas vesicle protein [Streptomyces sp. BK022]